MLVSGSLTVDDQTEKARYQREMKSRRRSGKEMKKELEYRYLPTSRSKFILTFR